MNVEGRLRALSAEIERLNIELRIVEEQIAFQQEVADDARLRSIVSETPLADREAAEASGDLARMGRTREDVMRRLTAMRSEQDGLLERMLDDR